MSGKGIFRDGTVLRIQLLIVPVLLCLISVEVRAQKDTARIYFNKGASHINVPTARKLDSLLAKPANFKSDNIVYVVPKNVRDPQGVDSLSAKRIRSIESYLLRRRSGMASFSQSLWDQEAVTMEQDEGWVDIVFNQEGDTGVHEADLSAVKKDETFVLRNLEFRGGSAVILESSKPALYALLRTLRDNPNMRIRLEGHVCCIYAHEGDTYEWGSRLSQERARAVYDFLREEGIPTSRISFIGFGNTRPLERNGVSDISDYRNRRVEVRILDR